MCFNVKLQVTNYTSKAQQSKRKDNEPHVGNSMIILTGANFSGKSVYLKQVATIVILAQLGSFVPAEEAHIEIHDAIFTRVSTTESASHSSLAFMINLQRVSFMSVSRFHSSMSDGFLADTLTAWPFPQHHRLRNCTMRSILLIDEFAKGTDPTG
jgi:DNA mismatch repair protein MSH5